MGLTEDVTARLAKAVWGRAAIATWRRSRPSRAGCRRPTRAWPWRCELAEEIQDFPRHLATHVGGFVITRGR